MRAGEILALTTEDLDFTRKIIRVDKSADDRTRQSGQPKTPDSVAMLPMPSALETVLQNYLKHDWKQNAANLLFPAPRKEGLPRSRNNTVRTGLKPILRKLKLPTKDVGLHAFRHGLASDLAEHSVPLPVLQQQMRHADVRTTLRVYAHAIPASQREVMEQQGNAIGTNVAIGTETSSQTLIL